MRLLRHQRRFMETAEDELELAWIPVDVSNGEDSRLRCFEFLGVYGDEIFVQVQAPVRDGAELHGETEEWQEPFGLDLELLLAPAATGSPHRQRFKLAPRAMQSRYLPQDECQAAFFNERSHLVD